jgi:hypothetical protein
LSAELTYEVCVDVAAELGLPHPGLVEKDFHVVRALGALSMVVHDGHRLVFGGGTSLCRAYRLIDRMSEDIDLRFEPLPPAQRKAFRRRVTDALQSVGFAFDPDDRNQVEVHDGSRTFVCHLPYPSVTPVVPSLREGIRAEVSSWPLRHNPIRCAVASFWAEATGRAPEIVAMSCVDPTETAADKFVALTRRIGEQQWTGADHDPFLLRHAHDLRRLRPAVDMAVLGSTIRAVMESDRVAYGKRFPAYADDPWSVCSRAIEALESDRRYDEEFERFQRDMVYGKRTNLKDCLPVIQEMAAAAKAL